MCIYSLFGGKRRFKTTDVISVPMNMERRDFFSVTSQNAKKKEKKTNTTKAEYI